MPHKEKSGSNYDFEKNLSFSFPGINFSVCIDTDWQNELLLPLEFNLPKNKVLNGLESEFDSDKRLVKLK